MLLLAAAVALAACAPARVLSSVATVGAAPAARHDVSYGPLPRQQLDVYLPQGAAPAGGWPLAVFFYGGSWNNGSRADYAFVGTALAARGVAAIVADYRLYPEVRYPDFLDDCARALAWGLEHARELGADPKRVFVMGHSAGGYNAAMLALDRRWLAAAGHAPGELAGWVGLAGAYDFFPTENKLAQPVFFHPNYPQKAQPIDFPSPRAPRTFLGAPVHDTVVSPTRSTQQLAAALQAQGVPVTLKFYDRVGHMTLIGAVAGPLRWLAPVLDDVAAFVTAAPPAP